MLEKSKSAPAERRVAGADGPERIFGEWLKADPGLVAVGDYFWVEDENGELH
jgi:protein ImuB